MSAWLDVAGAGLGTRLPCQSCGTWTCARCGWRRTGANLHYAGQGCSRCHSTVGSFTRTRHYSRWIWEDHNPLTGPRCQGWYRYTRADAGLPCQHWSCRQTAWGGAWEEWEEWS